MKDYSQNGEQKIILDYFQIDYFQKPRWEYLIGRFLDIGANDGETFSNSRLLALAGWKGVAVEPADVAFKKLHALYAKPAYPNLDPDVRCVNAAITTTDSPIDFYDSGTHLHQGDTSLLSTTRPEELARWKKSGEQFTKTTVRGITFATLLKECGVNHFDFITIDCEGADLDVLRQIDLTAVGCRLLCVEVNQRGDAEFTAYAKRHGMRLLWSSFENRIYCK